jgi:hypothetical protein
LLFFLFSFPFFHFAFFSIALENKGVIQSIRHSFSLVTKNIVKVMFFYVSSALFFLFLSFLLFLVFSMPFPFYGPSPILLLFFTFLLLNPWFYLSCILLFFNLQKESRKT